MMNAELEIIDTQLFTLLVKYVLEELPELDIENFGLNQNEDTDTKLPFIHLKRLTGIETATDMESDRLSGGFFTYQIKVVSNNSMSEADKISTQVTKAIKRLRFRSASMPVFTDTNNLHIKLSRWQREINEGDVLDIDF